MALKFFAGLSNGEIGRVVGMSESNVGTRLHRTMDKLREALDEDASDDFDLAAELRMLRPEPRAEFTAELDSRAASGFGKTGHARSSALARLAQAVRRVPPRRLAGLAGAAALLAITVSTALISISDPGRDSGPRGEADTGSPRQPNSHEFSRTPRAASGKPPSESSLAGGASEQATAAPEKGVPQAGYQYSARVGLDLTRLGA